MSSSKGQAEILVRIKINSKSKSELIELSVSRNDEKQDAFAFQSILTVNSVSETATWATDNVQPLTAYFIQYLQKILGRYDPEVDEISILEDSHSLLTLRSAYCQHCGKKLYESYGHAFGVVKKCSNCGRFSFYRDHK
jgi:NADH pyrophosphatase NudC (nudix superfamily)